MKRLSSILFISAFFFALAQPVSVQATDFEFNNDVYSFRWTDGQLFELTPEGQTDLDNWENMVSFIAFQSVKDGEALADMANGTLANYQSLNGLLLATNSVPASQHQPAEHFVAYLFISQDSFEFAANRMLLGEEFGIAVVYSQRFYNKKGEDGQFVSRWLEEYGPRIEQLLMAIPKSEIQLTTQSLLKHDSKHKAGL